jgi:hypothetical protein
MYREILESIPHDNRQLERYRAFIDARVGRNFSPGYDGVTHLHHICPKSMWREYSDLGVNTWNGIKLTPREHFIAHWMLWKSYRNVEMAYAFRFMRDHAKTGRAYSIACEEVYEAIREYNRNTIVVSHIDEPGKFFRLCREEYKNNLDEYNFHRQGFTHTDDTKKKIGHGNTELFWASKASTKEAIRVRPETVLPDGFVWGFPQWLSNGKWTAGKVWAHDPESGENVRVDTPDDLPEGYVLGRKFRNKALEIANKKVQVIDLIERRVVRVGTPDKTRQAPNNGQSAENTSVWVYGGMIFVGVKPLKEWVKENTPHVFIQDKHKPIGIIPGPKFKSEKYKEFLTLNEGKTYEEFGFKSIPLLEFDFNRYKDHKIWWKQ